MAYQQNLLPFEVLQNPSARARGELLHLGGPNWTPDRFGEAVQTWAKDHVTKSNICTLSLFTGAGGLDIGFHDAGFNVVEMVEIDKRYCETLERNVLPDGYFAQGHASCIDIRNYIPSKATKVSGRIELIIGGPPCQTFSAAGRRAAGVLGTREHRGTLFTEYVRLLRELKPRVFVFENVYGITGAGSGKDWLTIRQAFAAAGYDLYLRILDSADYGVPQHRERMFLVGVQSGEFKFPRPTHGPDSLSKNPHFMPHQALKGCHSIYSESLELDGRYGELLPQIPPGLNYSYFTEKMGHPRPLFAWRSKFSDFLYKADPDKPVRTIKAHCGKYTGPFHWDSRRFSVPELKRLQTFPDSYCLAGTRSSALQQIGNSVPPQMARILALSILDQVFKIPSPFPIEYMHETEVLGFRARKRSVSLHYKKSASKAISRSRLTVRNLQEHDFQNRVGTNTDFDFFIDTDQCDHWARFRYQPGEVVEISVNSQPTASCVGFTVTVAPIPGMRWIIPAPTVIMRGAALCPKIYFLLWRCFSHWLRSNHLMDDIVQLAGYYAYEPAITCNLALHHTGEWQWTKLQNVVSGVAVRKMLSKNDLADHMELSGRQVSVFIRFLRAIGYEVRSERTNPQLDDNSFLIPYSFPTFTRDSVQRHKNPLVT